MIAASVSFSPFFVNDCPLYRRKPLGSMVVFGCRNGCAGMRSRRQPTKEVGREKNAQG